MSCRPRPIDFNHYCHAGSVGQQYSHANLRDIVYVMMQGGITFRREIEYKTHVTRL